MVHAFEMMLIDGWMGGGAGGQHFFVRDVKQSKLALPAKIICSGDPKEMLMADG